MDKAHERLFASLDRFFDLIDRQGPRAGWTPIECFALVLGRCLGRYDHINDEGRERLRSLGLGRSSFEELLTPHREVLFGDANRHLRRHGCKLVELDPEEEDAEED